MYEPLKPAFCVLEYCVPRSLPPNLMKCFPFADRGEVLQFVMVLVADAGALRTAAVGEGALHDDCGLGAQGSLRVAVAQKLKARLVDDVRLDDLGVGDLHRSSQCCASCSQTTAAKTHRCRRFAAEFWLYW